MILNGWKQIAKYVNSSVRTVQRWQENGMPVIRPLPGSRGSVIAYSEHLDSWLRVRAHQFASPLATPVTIRHQQDFHDTFAKTEELRRQFQQTRRQMETHVNLLKAEVSLLRENLIRMKLVGNLYAEGQVLPSGKDIFLARGGRTRSLAVTTRSRGVA